MNEASISRLLVTEAIREYQKHYKDFKDKDYHIEAKVCALGKKPGFSMAMLMSRNQPDIDRLEGIGEFICQRIIPAVFSLPAKSTITQQKVLTVSFSGQLPSWFRSLTSPGAPLTPEQNIWFRAYAQFLAGICIGALAHFGFSAKATIEKVGNNSLSVSFVCSELEGSWEIACDM